MSGSRTQIHIGFIPLVDVAPLIVAAEEGFAEDEGLILHLIKETSWANIRDRVAIGHFEAAHMLAPMALVGSLGLPPLPVPIVAPIALGCGRNAITVSLSLWDRLCAQGDTVVQNAGDAVTALAAACAERHSNGEKPIFAVVHPYSAHAYLLRYWLAAGGLLADRDILIEVVPPPFMSDALSSGRIDGFCVGEPWNSVAVSQGVGKVIATSDGIWPRGPDKVLGFRADWAEANERLVLSLVRAVYKAAQWCDQQGNMPRLAKMLSAPSHLDMPAELILPGLQGGLGPGYEPPSSFEDGNTMFPWRSHAVWFLTQMARWGQAALTDTSIAAARATYRPDLYRTALQGLVENIPVTDDRQEGGAGAQGLFDRRVFEASAAHSYLAGFRP